MKRSRPARCCLYLLMVLILGGWPAGHGMAAVKPRVTILATGGTIAGEGAAATKTTDYTAGVMDIGALIKSVPGLDDVAEIRGEQVANIDSSHITDAVLLTLARRVNAVFDAGHADGIVITHGTDTMEETAYFLNLVVKSDSPVVITGSMRPATAISADGPLNLLNAVILAAAPASRGRGVLVAMNDEIHGARDVTKTNTTNVDTFRSPNVGPLGMVLDGQAHFYRRATRRHTTAAEFTLEGITRLPRVDILYAHGNDTRDLADAAVAAGARGIVHAGMGDGMVFPETYQALKAAAANGVVVVRASRVGSGMVAPGSDDARDGMLTADTLNPQKARILLMLGLTRTSDLSQIRRMFGEY